MAEVKGKTPKAVKPETEQVSAAPAMAPVESPAATSVPADPVAPAASLLEGAAVADPLNAGPFSVPAALVEPLGLSESQPEFWSFYGQTCQAAVDVLKERCRQVEGEGYSIEQDDTYTDYQLPRAAICYGIKAAGLPDHLERLYWPFRSSAVKPANRRRSLVKAAALLLAEIERLDRAENPVD
jgi:hypothetical protein